MWRLLIPAVAGALLLLVPTSGAHAASPDVDGNGSIDMVDVLLVHQHFGSFDPRYDVDGDGAVTMEDVAAVLRHVGRTPAPALPTRWIGVNNWNLASASDVNPICGSNSERLLEDKMITLKAAGVTVIRMAAFQSFAMDTTTAQRDWTAFDRVFDAARRHGMALIPMFGNNWSDCDYFGARPLRHARDEGTPVACGGAGNWYDAGYRAPYDGYLTGYRQWTQEFVGRYAHSGVVAAWELLNEPWETCIHDFFVDMIGVVRAIDPVTPISNGAGGGGEAWTANGGYLRESVMFDWLTAHDYDNPDDPLPVTPSCPDGVCVRADLRFAVLLGKPFYVGEAGIRESIAPCDTVQRAEKLRAKMNAAFDAGASGYVLWSYNHTAPPGQCGMDFGPQSPIMQMLRDVSPPEAAVAAD